MEAAERERQLSEQPVAVLRAHAQENGINTAGCVEIQDLVQRILHHEIHSFGGHASPGGDGEAVDGMNIETFLQGTERGSPAAASGASPGRPQSQADLAEDERLARRLQAEESSRAAILQAQQRERRDGQQGRGPRQSPDAMREAFDALSMAGAAGGGAERLRQQQQQQRQHQHRDLQQQHRRQIQEMQQMQERLEQQREQREARQSDDMGFAMPPGAGVGGTTGGGDPSGDAVMQLLELLSRGQRGGARGPAAGGAPPGNPGGVAAGRGRGAAGQPAFSPDALQLVLGQLLASNGAGPGGPSMLAEMLASLGTHQGIDQACVAARTGEMVYREPEGGASSGAGGSDGAPNEEERKCMVCLELFTGGEDLRILPCLHRYHKDCIDQWLARNRHCPVCKHDITQ